MGFLLVGFVAIKYFTGFCPLLVTLSQLENESPRGKNLVIQKLELVALPDVSFLCYCH